MAEYRSKYEGNEIENLLDFANALKAKLRYWVSPDPTSPAQLFGGTWVKIEGKFVLGADGNVYPALSTGGSADAVVVEHYHPQLKYLDGTVFKWRQSYVTGDSGGISMGEGNDVITATVGESGTGKNMPPYIALHAWYKV